MEIVMVEVFDEAPKCQHYFSDWETSTHLYLHHARVDMMLILGAGFSHKILKHWEKLRCVDKKKKISYICKYSLTPKT